MEQRDDDHEVDRNNSVMQLRRSPSPPGKRMKMNVAPLANKELPSDVLGVISKKLDIDDLFEFAGVCKSWHKFHKIFWRDFMTSKEPLLIQICSQDNEVAFFLKLGELGVYQSKVDYFSGLSYCGNSNGYLITARDDSLLLTNPFTRRKKSINTMSLLGEVEPRTCHPLLAFVKGSDEFILILCKSYNNLYVYKSQSKAWYGYKEIASSLKIVDFVVFNNAIYALTSTAKIAVLSLTNARLEFLRLKNVPNVNCLDLKLVKSEMGLLVVHHNAAVKDVYVYKIDLSKLEYTKVSTLDNLTLFYAFRTKCYALSNPGKWGYKSNNVYYADGSPSRMYFGEDDPIRQNAPTLGSKFYFKDWWFRNQRDEVDFSLSN